MTTNDFQINQMQFVSSVLIQCFYILTNLQAVYITHSTVKSCRRLLSLHHLKSHWKNSPRYGACKLGNISLSLIIYTQLSLVGSKVSVLNRWTIFYHFLKRFVVEYILVDNFYSNDDYLLVSSSV